MPALPLVSICRGLCRAGPRGLGDLVPDGLKTAGAASTKIGADHKGFISVYPFDEFEAAGAPLQAPRSRRRQPRGYPPLPL